MRRPWRIEFRYKLYTTDRSSGFLPWTRLRSSFATRENAERFVDGDFGWWLSYGVDPEHRIVNVDEAGPA